MSDRTYKIILEGTVKAGAERTSVVEQLARLFRKDSHTAEKLLAGKPRIIRRHVDHPTALKYQKVLETAGAEARIEPEDEPLVKIVPVQSLPEADGSPSEPEAMTCPRCGYESKRQDDVLRVRGDCPRCGLQVTRPDDLADPAGTSEDDDLDRETNGESAYPGMDAASWERRACAAMCTLALFLALCFFFVLMSILFLVPMESVPEYLTRGFLEAALTSFPTLTASVAIFIVLFVMPLATGGRTWGQKAFGIQLFFTDEGQTGGLALSLAFRTVAAGLVSFLPGRFVLWVLTWWEIFPEWKWEWFLMGVAALLGWSIAWVYGVRRADGRGLLDQAAGTMQLEEGLLPAGALTKASKPLAGMVALILFVGVALPYAVQWLKK